MSRGHGAESLRAVLDTNIYIAAFEFPNGRNAALWRAAINGRYRLFVSPAIICETARVLRANFEWREDRIQKVIRRIAHVDYH
jgi:predicted nucleic acid-binding protein